MPYPDLREFLAALEKHGQLVRIDREIMPEPHLGAAGYAAANMEGGPAVLFTRVKGYRQQVLLNLHGSWPNLALAFELARDTPVKELVRELSRRWDNYPLSHRRLDNSPVKEVVVDRGINLFHQLPLFRINLWDGGCYISKGTVISKDIVDGGAQNVGIYRIQVKGVDRVGLHVSPMHDLAIQFKKAEALDRPFPVAIAIGNDPVVPFVASAALKYHEDEYAMMGALRGEPLATVAAETCDLEVPAGAELVMEGEMIPRFRSVEGPFGEFTSYYSRPMLEGEVKIKLIYHRREPVIFENLYLGRPFNEIDYLLGVNTSVVYYKQLLEEMPEVTGVNAMFTHGQTVIVSTRSRTEGFAKAVACRVLSLPHGIGMTKNVILVDDDIDPFNLQQVIWAINTRFRPDDDLVLLRNMSTTRLDPTSSPRGIATKMIVDATSKAAREMGGRLVGPPPGWEEWRDEIVSLIRR